MTRDTGRPDPRRPLPQLGRGELDRLIFGPQPSAADEDGDVFEPSREPLFPATDQAAPARPARRPGATPPDYIPLPDDPGAYRRPRERSPAPLFLGAAAVILCLFAAVLWNTYRDGVRSESEAALPQLAGGVFKVRPAEVPSPSSPEIAASVLEETAARPSPAGTSDERASSGSAAAPPAPEPASKPAPEPPPAPALPPSSPPAAATAAAPGPPAAAPPSASGPFSVQLAAAGSEEAARSEWRRIRSLDPALFEGRSPVIARAEVGGRVVFRLRIAGFPSAEAAGTFCDSIKARGADCFRASG